VLASASDRRTSSPDTDNGVRVSPRRRLAQGLAILTLATIWYLLCAPTGLGGPVGLIWVSGTSMEPGLKTGDLVIVYEHDSYEVGDVVAFEILGGGQVIHRIIERTDDGYRFQGDNRDFADPWVIGHGDIVGAAALEIPKAGTVMTMLGRPPVLAVLVMALVGLAVLRPRSDKTPTATATATATESSGRTASGAD
jgi:signal peptidase I